MDTMTPRGSRLDDSAPARNGDRSSLAGLFSNLWRDISGLLRDEVALAKAEMSEKASQLGSGVAAVAAGGAILFAGFIVLLFAAVAGLAYVLPEEHAAWLAPLLVGGVVTLIGYVVLSGGRRELRARNLKPARTLDSIKRDAQLAREHVR
jgi:hypothetical protein